MPARITGMAGLALAVAIAAPAALAQTLEWSEDGGLQPLESGFPSGPIRLWNVHPPGHADETEARVLADIASEFSPVPIAVESAASGPLVHYAWFDRLEGLPDGTDGLHVAVGSINGIATRLMTYDIDYTLDDLKRAVLLVAGYTANMLIVHPETGFDDVQELVAYAKANPGDLRIATCQAGCGQHITLEQFAQTAGFDYRPIPHTGTAQAVLTLQGGGVQAATASPSYIKPLVDEGAVVPVLQWGPRRSDTFPEVPTAGELGFGAGVQRSVGLVTHPDVGDAEKAWLTELFKRAYKTEEYQTFAAERDYSFIGLEGAEADAFVQEVYDVVRPITIQLGLATERNSKE